MLGLENTKEVKRIIDVALDLAINKQNMEHRNKIILVEKENHGVQPLTQQWQLHHKTTSLSATTTHLFKYLQQEDSTTYLGSLLQCLTTLFPSIQFKPPLVQY